MSSGEVLAAFQSISSFTGEMKEAARAGEWDRLAVLERCCAGVVAQLRAVQPVRLPASMQRQKVELIRKIRAANLPGYVYIILLTAKSETKSLV